MYLLGFDLGSSSVKAAIIKADTGQCVASATYPKTEMDMIAHQPGWAEQDPQLWWDNAKKALAEALTNANIKGNEIEAIGISYQMHGLVVVDKNLEVLRPSIIWCDSRAVEIGKKAFEDIGEKKALENLLNSPGNFTASKLKWVKINERDIYDQVYKFMLPGDYLAMKLSGEVQTTASGLSEGILWDFVQGDVADMVLSNYKFDKSLVPDRVETFAVQAELSPLAAQELGLKTGTKISYRAGDQPNNAFSLNVLNPGEVAATAGTSGVVYGIVNTPTYDKKSRVNTFVHVNHAKNAERYGVLLCINGTGIQNSWLKNTLFGHQYSYDQMNAKAAQIKAGSDGVRIYPFGNGTERVFENQKLGGSICGLGFNTHSEAHIMRAAQEGIAFGLHYGMNIMRKLGIQSHTVRAGEANMFLSPVFREAFVNTTGTVVELFNTDGAQGAARGAGIGAGIYKDFKEAFHGLKKIKTLEPDKVLMQVYQDAYQAWAEALQ